MVMKPSRTLDNVVLLKKAKLMARAGVEKKLLEEFEKKRIERVFNGRKDFADRPAIKKTAFLLNRTVGRVAGLALERGLGKRSEKIFRQIEPYIEENSRVLDLGCGDGKIGYLINLDKKCDVQLMDTVNCNKTPLPFEFYDGISIKRPANSFDHVMLITALHHSDDPVLLMKEALRVAEKSVVVIESVYFEKVPMHRKMNSLVDWFSSRVLNDPEINVPFNFLTPAAWVAVFQQLGGKVVGMEKLGFDQPLVPEYHFLYEVKPE